MSDTITLSVMALDEADAKDKALHDFFRVAGGHHRYIATVTSIDKVARTTYIPGEYRWEGEWEAIVTFERINDPHGHP